MIKQRIFTAHTCFHVMNLIFLKCISYNAVFTLFIRRFLVDRKHNMTQHEDGVLWKLFLLSMLLQGRRDAYTRRTGEHWECVTRHQSTDMCLFRYGLLTDRFPSGNWLAVCSTLLNDGQSVPAALAKWARKPSNTPTWWGKVFSFSLVYTFNALPLNTQICRCWKFLVFNINSHIVFLRQFSERFVMKRMRFSPEKTMKWATF